MSDMSTAPARRVSVHAGQADSLSRLHVDMVQAVAGERPGRLRSHAELWLYQLHQDIIPAHRAEADQQRRLIKGLVARIAELERAAAAGDPAQRLRAENAALRAEVARLTEAVEGFRVLAEQAILRFGQEAADRELAELASRPLGALGQARLRRGAWWVRLARRLRRAGG